MQDLTWKICQYFFSEECPYQSEISKAILIPQMLGPAEMEQIKKLCENCEKCRNEKRTSLRIKKPLRVAVAKHDMTESTQGTIVDISSTGALIKLDEWLELTMGEMLEVKIYFDAEDFQTQVSVENQRCVIKRLAKESNQLAIMFTN